MNPPASEYSLSISRTGSILGHCRVNGIMRKGAHFYEVPSTKNHGTYIVYLDIEKAYQEQAVALGEKHLDPDFLIHRCSCHKFVTTGDCHHKDGPVAFELYVFSAYPDNYRAELARRLEKKLSSVS